MGTHLVEPGSVLADRYVVEDLLAQEAGSESWRALDNILARSVVLQMLPSSSPRADDLIAAAKQASRITDTRIQQVLDAVDDGELSYVVREWAGGQSLDVTLTNGPLPARRAAWLLREVAAAMTSAHQAGIPHRRLVPDNVVITKSSGVKLIGVGTAAVLHGDAFDDEDAERTDTQDIGRLLYACLTARWPGNDWSGLPHAPTEHDRLLRPRQVRAGVPRALDGVCDRILSDHSRYGPPITTVAEVNDNLTRLLADDSFAGGSGLAQPTETNQHRRLEPPPAVVRRDDEAPQTGEQPVYDPTSNDGSSIGRTLVWTVVIALVLGAVLLAYLIGQHGANQVGQNSTHGDGTGSAGSNSTGSSSTSQSGTLRVIPLSTATSFDPTADGGSGSENPAEAKLAIDGSDATGWSTVTYYDRPDLGGQKPGVGLVVDLGSVTTVSEVKVLLAGGATGLEVRAAPRSAIQAPMTTYTQYAEVASDATATGSTTLDLSQPVVTRFLLIYLTDLPPIGPGEYRGTIDDIQVLG